MLMSWGGVETTCYWPDELEIAEGLLPFTPVTPCDIVRHYTHLSLTQVLLKTGAGPNLGKPIRSITYIFGTIPGKGGGIPEPAPPEPRLVVVEELPGPWHQGPALDRTAYHPQMPGAAEQSLVYGTWRFCATLPSGSEHLVVIANVDPETIESIGRTMVGVTQAR
jgi:hypothetical protein